MHMAAIDTDQSLMRKALDESGRWTAVHLGSYENFVRDQFCFLLGALIVPVSYTHLTLPTICSV